MVYFIPISSFCKEKDCELFGVQEFWCREHNSSSALEYQEWERKIFHDDFPSLPAHENTSALFHLLSANKIKLVDLREVFPWASDKSICHTDLLSMKKKTLFVCCPLRHVMAHSDTTLYYFRSISTKYKASIASILVSLIYWYIDDVNKYRNIIFS